jgi:hypothetical protein
LLRASNFRTSALPATFENFRLWPRFLHQPTSRAVDLIEKRKVVPHENSPVGTNCVMAVEMLRHSRILCGRGRPPVCGTVSMMLPQSFLQHLDLSRVRACAVATWDQHTCRSGQRRVVKRCDEHFGLAEGVGKFTGNCAGGEKNKCQ